MATKKSSTDAQRLADQRRREKRYIERLRKAHLDSTTPVFLTRAMAEDDFALIRAVVYTIIDGTQKRAQVEDELAKAITAACKAIRARAER